MTYEKMKACVKARIDQAWASKLRLGWERKDIDLYVKGILYGMVKAFQAARLLTNEQALDLYCEFDLQ